MLFKIVCSPRWWVIQIQEKKTLWECVMYMRRPVAKLSEAHIEISEEHLN